jgi:excisionase family DNA binding protein
MDKIYTTEQVAELLQVSVITIRRYIKSNRLKASRIGKDYRIQEKDLVKLLEDTKT